MIDPELLQSIFSLSEKRIRFLREKNDAWWYHGSDSHFDSLFHELEEVRVEVENERYIYLEDELGDVFWNYSCLLDWLEQEGKIDKARVFERCYQKFSERIGPDALGNGDWEKIKKSQKARLKQEQESL